TKRVLEYYACGNWKNKGTTVCRSNGVRADYADKYVFDKISKIANNDVLIKRIVENVNQKNKDGLDPLRQEFETLKKSLNAIEAKKEKVLGLYEDGVIV